MSASTCPRCLRARQFRDGPYFVCTDCRWCWTVSITGKVYLQSRWPPRDARDTGQLLASIEGLAERLSANNWPEPPPRSASNMEQERLERARAAIAADFYNEGLPLAQLKAEGVFLPAPEGD